jgi:hypothetical protein
LGQLIQACDSDFVGTDLAKEINEARNALLATDAGTHYEIAQAKAALSLAKRRKP